MPPHRTALVAALEREIRPLVKDWRRAERKYDGRRFVFFEQEDRIAVCGGIGAQAARRAAEAIISLYQPAAVWSIGFAGALDANRKAGSMFLPNVVIDASDGSRTQNDGGDGILVSFSAVAGVEQKMKLCTAYGAQAVDMEAAAVATSARKHGISFRAVKVISDEAGQTLPAMERFIAPAGEFRTAGFAMFAALRPWMWKEVFQLSRNTRSAALTLGAWLNHEYGNPGAESLHQTFAGQVHGLK